MGFPSSTSRVQFEIVLNQYKDYLDLYKAINKNSIVGATDFGVFYLRMTFEFKYNDNRVFLTTSV